MIIFGLSPGNGRELKQKRGVNRIPREAKILAGFYSAKIRARSGIESIRNVWTDKLTSEAFLAFLCPFSRGFRHLPSKTPLSSIALFKMASRRKSL